jgi:blue light- and temperature-responsive anti-repressor
VRCIEGHGPRQAIVRGLVQTCSDLGIDIVAKGVTTTEEFSWMFDEGIELFQGELFAPAGFETLPRPMLPVG